MKPYLDDPRRANPDEFDVSPVGLNRRADGVNDLGDPLVQGRGARM